MEISYTFMTEEDIPQIAALERQAYSQPWSEQGLKHYLDAGMTMFIVARDEETIAGYAAVLCICDEGNLVSIVVDENYRRMGIASEILDILYEELKKEDVNSINLEVRESNLPAITLYEQEGFEKVGKRKGFYDKPKEDALLYIKAI